MSTQVKTLPPSWKVTQTHGEKKGSKGLCRSLDSVRLKFAHCPGNHACKFVSFFLLFHLLVDDYVLVAKDKHGYNVEQVHSQAVLKCSVQFEGGTKITVFIYL